MVFFLMVEIVSNAIQISFTDRASIIVILPGEGFRCQFVLIDPSG